jgi:uncharacterized protein YdeI (YjbR/CyaY-like superfamily)
MMSENQVKKHHRRLEPLAPRADNIGALPGLIPLAQGKARYNTIDCGNSPSPIRDTAMGSRDARVDAYIAKSKDFAKPILTYLRDLVHTTCPEVEETVKWSFPHFMYKGMLCAMSSHKEHCSFGFWKGSLVLEDGGARNEEGMGHFGRITKLSDLPSKKVLTGCIKKAMELNEEGVKRPALPKPKTPKPVVVPDDLTKALQANAAAQATFERFSPSHKREYIEWITEAKTEATRTKRLQTAIEWMVEGKPRNWKYMNC